MTKGTHLLRSALLALLALAVISGGSLAAGDLFDDDYSDCPHRTRLRDGQISDLSVNRDSDEEDEVNVSWGATDPATWGLGPNAYSTSLVVILDDGSNDPDTKTMSLGSRKTTFDGVATGAEVTVQMAIVVDTPDGDYLISDILEADVNQSLTAPKFSAAVLRLVTAADPDGPDDDLATTADNIPEDTTEATGGTMYYVGYNENFGNYKADTNLSTMPATPRLRIGLRHGGEDGDKRDDVDFDGYLVRIEDNDGDEVAGDFKTSATSARDGFERLQFGTCDAAFADDAPAFSNVRISDDGDHAAAFFVTDGQDPECGVDGAGTWAASDITPGAFDMSRVRAAPANTANDVFAPHPDQHYNFPIDVLTSDQTYKISAWAINEDDEVISPVATLTVAPIDTHRTTTDPITDYLGANAAAPTGLVVTEFTVKE